MSALVEPREVFHIATGRTVMNAVDANSAVSNSPREWSLEPWSPAVVEKVEARIKRNEELNNVPVVGALKPPEEQR